MTPAQRAAALRLAAVPISERSISWQSDATMLLRELAAEPAQEPVAWHVCSVNNDGSLSLEHAAAWKEAAHEHINDAINDYDIEEASSWVVRPVYASPQPQQTEPSQDTPPQRQPLSDEQIKSLPAWWPSYDGHSAIIELVRSVERAHGIGETK